MSFEKMDFILFCIFVSPLFIFIIISVFHTLGIHIYEKWETRNFGWATEKNRKCIFCEKRQFKFERKSDEELKILGWNVIKDKTFIGEKFEN